MSTNGMKIRILVLIVMPKTTKTPQQYSVEQTSIKEDKCKENL